MPYYEETYTMEFKRRKWRPARVGYGATPLYGEHYMEIIDSSQLEAITQRTIKKEVTPGVIPLPDAVVNEFSVIAFISRYGLFVGNSWFMIKAKHADLMTVTTPIDELEVVGKERTEKFDAWWEKYGLSAERKQEDRLVISGAVRRESDHPVLLLTPHELLTVHPDQFVKKLAIYADAELVLACADAGIYFYDGGEDVADMHDGSITGHLLVLVFDGKPIGIMASVNSKYYAALDVISNATHHLASDNKNLFQLARAALPHTWLSDSARKLVADLLNVDDAVDEEE